MALHAALVPLFQAGMCGFALTGDLFNAFVFFELMSVVAYALTGYRAEEAKAVQGALTFGVINSLGAYATLTPGRWPPVCPRVWPTRWARPCSATSHCRAL